MSLLSKLQAANVRLARAVKAQDEQAQADARRDQAYAKLVYEIDRTLDGVVLTGDQRRELCAMLSGQPL